MRANQEAELIKGWEEHLLVVERGSVKLPRLRVEMRGKGENGASTV